MARLGFELKGIKELRGKLERMQSEQPKALGEGLVKGGLIIKESIRLRAPVGETGNLRNSLTMRQNKKGGVTIGVTVGHTRKGAHAHLVEFGTQPHAIKAGTFRGRPSGSKVLSTGEEFLGATVMHPGAKARPYFFPGYISSRSRALQVIIDEVDASLHEVADA